MLDRPGQQPVVGVDDEEQWAVAPADAEVDRPRLATVDGLNIVDGDLAALDLGADELLRAVGGTVVDDHPHEVVGGLRHEALVEHRQNVGSEVPPLRSRFRHPRRRSC